MLPENRSKPKLLIVEDYAAARLCFHSAAADSGYFAEVHSMPDAESANQFIQTAISGGSVPEIVVSDLYMPEINGIEFLSALRRQAATAKTVCVLISVGNDACERQAARSARCDAFFQKPTSIEALHDLLKSVAGLYRPADNADNMETSKTAGDNAPRCRVEFVGCNSAMFACSDSEIAG